MSKFIEKLKNQTQKTPAPLGFGKVSSQEKPRMLVVVALIGDDNVGERLKGADAGFISTESIVSLTEVLPKLNKSNPDIMWGGYLKHVGTEKADAKNVAADFIVFSPETALFKIPDNMGKILEITDTISDTQLRAIDDLPVDAVYFAVKPEVITWQYLITIQRFDNLLAKPLLAAVPHDVKIEELQTLWSVGVDGIVIEATASGKLTALREEIERTAFPLPRKSTKAGVRIPFISQSSAEESDEEEEDE